MTKYARYALMVIGFCLPYILYYIGGGELTRGVDLFALTVIAILLVVGVWALIETK